MHIGLLARGRDGLEGARGGLKGLGASAEGSRRARFVRRPRERVDPQLWASMNRNWLAIAGAGLAGLAVGLLFDRAPEKATGR